MNYIIIFDNSQLQFNINDIHRFITTSPQVNDWWHYLPNVYIVDTNMSAKVMSDSMLSQYQGLRFFITKINLDDYNGVLAEGAWEWIKKKTKQIFGLKPVSKSSQMDLLDLFKNQPKLS